MNPTLEKFATLALGIAAAVCSQLAMVNDTPAENILLTIAGILVGKEMLRTSADKAQS